MIKWIWLRFIVATYCESATTNLKQQLNHSFPRIYQENINNAKLDSLNVLEYYRLPVGNSVSIRLPEYNSSNEVIWVFKANSLGDNDHRRYYNFVYLISLP